LVGHRDPSLFIPRANFQPAPTSESVRVNPCLKNLSREASDRHHSTPTVLILPHSFVNIISNNAPRFLSNTDDIPELVFLRGLAPICLSFACCQNIGVELPAKLFKLLILVLFVKIPKLLKFSIKTQIQLSGFSRGACLYPCIRKKSPI
jgi:hypothetical protein